MNTPMEKVAGTVMVVVFVSVVIAWFIDSARR